MVNFLPLAMEHLARNPDDAALLRRDPSRLTGRIEELLRRFPLVAQARLVTRAPNLTAVQLKAGDMVLCPSTLHGIDERENDRPLEIDFARRAGSHSTFGGGAHICAGMHLARLEILVTLQEWFERIPAFRLEEGFWMIAHSGVVARFEQLNLEWDV